MAMSKRSLLNEFAKWLKKERDCTEEAIQTLLFEEWDGAYPESLLGEDIVLDIENFMHDMAQFALEKVFGKSADCDERFLILIIPYGSYEDCSSVYVLEMKTKTVLASLEEKTWHFSPRVIEEGLEDLIEQLKGAKKLLAIRLVSDS